MLKLIKATKNTERLKIQDFNICLNILHVDADAGDIAIALLYLSAGMPKTRIKQTSSITSLTFKIGY